MKKKIFFLTKNSKITNKNKYDTVDDIEQCDFIITTNLNFKNDGNKIKKKNKTIMNTSEKILYLFVFFKKIFFNN
jgi:hypothetical protein